MTTSGQTYYAKFSIIQYTITYNENGGSTVADANYYITSRTITLPTNSAKTNYLFNGWKVTTVIASTVYKSSGVYAAVNDTITQVYTGSHGNITVQAQWQLNTFQQNVYATYNTATSATTSTSTYNYGGTGGSVGFSSNPTAAFDTTDAAYNSTAYFYADAETGYSFAGWYYLYNYTLSGFVSSNNPYSLTVTSTDTLYAKFSIQQYALTTGAYYNTSTTPTTFSSGTTGGTVTAGSNVYYGKTVSLTATPATGYTFGGWYSDSNLTTR